jgi:hypothetical protein
VYAPRRVPGCLVYAPRRVPGCLMDAPALSQGVTGFLVHASALSQGCLLHAPRRFQGGLVHAPRRVPGRCMLHKTGCFPRISQGVLPTPLSCDKACSRVKGHGGGRTPDTVLTRRGACSRHPGHGGGRVPDTPWTSWLALLRQHIQTLALALPKNVRLRIRTHVCAAPWLGYPSSGKCLQNSRLLGSIVQLFLQPWPGHPASGKCALVRVRILPVASVCKIHVC